MRKFFAIAFLLVLVLFQSYLTGFRLFIDKKEIKLFSKNSEYRYTFLLQPISERFFKNGKKEGTHRAWYPNGKLQFLRNYSNGEFQGDQWAWYDTGSLYRYSNYDRGVEKAQKMWRQNGMIYINYVHARDRVYGLRGSKLCAKSTNG